MNEWGFSRDGGIEGEWPRNDAGELVPPAFLEHVAGDPMAAKLTRTMLAAYGIATVCRYPNDGELGKVLFGYAGGGVDIFVPETLLEDARNIISTDLSEEESLPEEGLDDVSKSDEKREDD